MHNSQPNSFYTLLHGLLCIEQGHIPCAFTLKQCQQGYEVGDKGNRGGNLSPCQHNWVSRHYGQRRGVGAEVVGGEKEVVVRVGLGRVCED